MVTITEAAIRQNVYETIYDIINGISFTTSSTPTLTAAFVDSSQAFPQIVLHPVDIVKDNRTFGIGAFDKEIRILIDIWTKKNKDKDIIADEIHVALDATSFSGILWVGCEESNALESPGNDKLHLKSVTLTFMRK